MSDINTTVLTPKQRGELRRQQKLQRRTRANTRISYVIECFGQVRHVIAQNLSFYDQIQFNKISPNWYISLRSTEKYISVFEILNGLYRHMCMASFDHYYNPITQERFDGKVSGSKYNSRYHVVTEIERKEAHLKMNYFDTRKKSIKL